MVINIKTDTSYQYHLIKLENSGKIIKDIVKNNRVMIIADDITFGLWGQKLITVLKDTGILYLTFVFPNGEQSKNLAIYSQAMAALATAKMTRSDKIIALGGGVVGDLAGFVAATYMRGIDFINIPTTLLSAIDSSVGGKTGLDLEQGKNLVGAFWQPKAVIFDTQFVDTLPDNLIKDGLGEGIKYAVLQGGRLLEILKDGFRNNLEEWVGLCVMCKKTIVEKDVRDTGIRRLLNLGHTFGHIIEKLSQFSIPHGAAISKGMSIIINISINLGLLSELEADTILALYRQYDIDLSQPYSYLEMSAYLALDKKVSDKKLSLVLISCIGKCIIRDIDLEKLGELNYAINSRS